MDELIHKLAAASDTSHAKAADEIDKLIHGILKKLRSGQAAQLPGFGHLSPQREFCPEAGSDASEPRC